MGRKIFVSYKYADDQVENLSLWGNSTVRDYVTEFESLIDSTDHIYKGESDETARKKMCKKIETW